MRSVTELKQIFQAGWNVPSRIENYTRAVAEFTDGETHTAWRTTLAAALGTDERLRILDVGTGPGIFACLYAQMGHDAVGLDFSERMLGVARQRSTELRLDCEFVFADAEDPPFDDAMFDAVSSRHVLFNLPRPGVAVRQWARVLKPGGRMILMGNEPMDRSDTSLAARSRQIAQWCRLRWARRRRGPNSWATPGYRQAVSECPLFRHGSGTLRAVMEAAGLQDIHLQSTDAIQAARRIRPRRKPRGLMMSNRFFILVGVKP